MKGDELSLLGHLGLYTLLGQKSAKTSDRDKGMGGVNLFFIDFSELKTLVIINQNS